MAWFFAAVVVAVVIVALIAAKGKLGAQGDAVPDDPVPVLPESGKITSNDLENIRFSVVTRGYSMIQVDDLLDRLAQQLLGEEETSATETSIETPESDEAVGLTEAEGDESETEFDEVDGPEKTTEDADLGGSEEEGES